MHVNMSEVSLEEVSRSLLEREPTMASGGFWKPKDCLPRWKVSVDVILLKGLFTKKVLMSERRNITNDPANPFQLFQHDLSQFMTV